MKRYLRELMIILCGEEGYGPCQQLEKRLRQAGIGCRYGQWEDAEGRGREGVLWLTDNAAWASGLAEKGEAVLYYLHPAEECGGGEEAERERLSACIRYACEKPEELEISFLEGVYRRYKGIPWEICETERCLIRETTVEDVAAFYEIYKEPEITRYMENLYEDPEKERAYIRDYIDKIYGFYDFGIWTVTLKGSGQVIGRAGLTYREGYGEPELGFVIGVPWQKKGFASEVCRAVLDYGRENYGFDRVQAFVRPGNRASVKLCEKLGFVRREELVMEGTEYARYMIESG